MRDRHEPRAGRPPTGVRHWERRCPPRKGRYAATISDEPYLRGWRQAPDGTWLSPEEQRQLPAAPSPRPTLPVPTRAPSPAPAPSRPAPVPVPAPASASAAAPGRQWETWHLVAVGLVALLVGFAIGGRGKDSLKDVVAAGPGTTADPGLSIPSRSFPSGSATGASPTSPIPLRQEGRPAGAQWSVKVVDVTPDAAAAVRAADPLGGKSAPAGRQYVMATVELGFTGLGTEAPSAVDLEAVGASNTVYRPSRDTCGVIPKRYSDGRSLRTGETVQGNVCWAVKTEDVSSLVLIAHAQLSDRDPLYFALR